MGIERLFLSIQIQIHGKTAGTPIVENQGHTNLIALEGRMLTWYVEVHKMINAAFPSLLYLGSRLVLHRGPRPCQAAYLLVAACHIASTP